MEKFVESLFGTKIFASPFLVGVVLGLICKVAIGGQTGNILLVVMTAAGALAGFILLKVIRKRMSYSDFDAKVSASPDIDEAVKIKD
ncbi:Uncharacterised protein [Chryseobacterium taklimakanense]|uniref:Uncharacterized protein n=1 Tax=Chryseobacterium taklimakanense TaxID=536441 RepID=A0A239WHT5_9FLAO|nr:hypothetical protein [Chryseobacterium taklimakanense]SNV33670.1 Uncharacterised protein [Chryseobacterium taklimakanense]